MANREPKIGGQVKVTYEMLNEILCLPEGCRVVGVEQDSFRDLVAVKFHANEARRGVSYQIGEGMEYPTISIDSNMYGVKALKLAKEIEEKAALGERWAVNALNQFQLEQDSNEE